MGQYVIAVDGMGGDNAPEAVVSGCIDAARRWNDIRILLSGPESRLSALLAEAKDVADRFEILPAKSVISMHDSPMMAVHHKKDSSMVIAAEAVREGRAQAMISAGSTGAVLACGMLRIGRIPGIERPALGVVLPTTKEPFMLLDCGANVDCRPGYLMGFGLMGSVYMRAIQDYPEPRVGLINIGTEPEKGNRLAKETFSLMSAQSAFRFEGNVEAREILSGVCDVAVADGFDGNVVLKLIEGSMSAMAGMLKDCLMDSPRTKLGALLAKPALRKFKSYFDYNQYGGAPLLGLRSAVIKAHGASGQEAIASAVRQARKMIEMDVCGKILSGVASMGGFGDAGENEGE